MEVDRGIRVSCWNARGYLASIPYIRELLSECDILALSEHWVYENQLYKLNDISDSHHCFARSSKMASAEDYGKGRGQGGVALFWKKSLTGVSIVSDIIMDRACAIRMQTPSYEIFHFVSVYLPSQGNPESLETTLDEISEILESREEQSFTILLGDFNGDIGNSGGPRAVTEPTVRGRKVMGFFNRHGLLPLNMQLLSKGPIYTYEGQLNKSTLDYIAVPTELLGEVIGCKVYDWSPLNTSDHLPVHAHIRLADRLDTDAKSTSKGRVKWNKLSQFDRFTRYHVSLNLTCTTSKQNFLVAHKVSKNLTMLLMN